MKPASGSTTSDGTGGKTVSRAVATPTPGAPIVRISVTTQSSTVDTRPPSLRPLWTRGRTYVPVGQAAGARAASRFASICHSTVCSGSATTWSMPASSSIT